MNTQELKPIRVPQGQCMACSGSSGQLVADYVDIYDRYHTFKFLICPCCDGGGTNCLRCWPQRKNGEL